MQYASEETAKQKLLISYIQVVIINMFGCQLSILRYFLEILEQMKYQRRLFYNEKKYSFIQHNKISNFESCES